jgi:hypothetical protein
VETRSQGTIRFPARYAEGYAYLKNRIYGDRPGVWQGANYVWLWMPRGLIGVSSPQVNYIAARSGNGKTLYLALTNQSSEPVTVALSLNRNFLLSPVLNPKVTIPARGLATFTYPIATRTRFQQEFLRAPGEPWAHDEARTAFIGGDVVGMILNFGPTLQHAFVYLQATYLEIREAKLIYQINNDPEFVLTSARYPFEFTVALPAGARSLRYRIEATLHSGELRKTNFMTLQRKP